MRADRETIKEFMQMFSEQLGIAFPTVIYPEDDSSVPSDARIDALYRSVNKEVHIEHTSVDLIVSGKRNKRSLDPAFILIEEALSKSSISPQQGIDLHFPIESARDIKRVKDGLPELVENVGTYIQQLDAIEWEKYPRKPDSISANGM